MKAHQANGGFCDFKILDSRANPIKANSLQIRMATTPTAANKKPFYKKIWFWVLIVIFLLVLISGSLDEESDTASDLNTVTAPEGIETQVQELGTIEQLWTALDKSLHTRRGYDIQFNETTGLVTLTDTP